VITSAKRALTADTVLRIARFFGTDARSWMNLQTHYGLDIQSGRLVDKFESVITYVQIPNG
jgi:plasmid maintenance system antidote protein VapI